MTAHKSLAAHNYVTSGWTKKPVMKRVSRIRTLAVYKVKLKFDWNDLKAFVSQKPLKVINVWFGLASFSRYKQPPWLGMIAPRFVTSLLYSLDILKHCGSLKCCCRVHHLASSLGCWGHELCWFSGSIYIFFITCNSRRSSQLSIRRIIISITPQSVLSYYAKRRKPAQDY